MFFLLDEIAEFYRMLSDNYFFFLYLDWFLKCEFTVSYFTGKRQKRGENKRERCSVRWRRCSKLKNKLFHLGRTLCGIQTLGTLSFLPDIALFVLMSRSMEVDPEKSGRLTY